MKKIFSVIVLVVVAAFVIPPKFIAPKFQEQVNITIDKINKMPGYVASIESTESSWFASKNIITISVDLGQYQPSLENEQIELQFALDTQYGPLLFANQGIIGLYQANIIISGDEQRTLLTWDDTQPLYQLSALSGFDGNVKFEDKVPAFTSLEKDFTFSGYNGEGQISNAAFSYDGLVSQVALDNPEQPVKAENIALSMQINTDLETIMKGGFYDSTANVSIGTFTAGTEISASGLAMIAKTTLDNDTQLGTVELSYLAKEFAYSDYQVSDLTLITELAKFSNQFFLDYTSYNESLVEQNLSYEDLIKEQLSFLENNIEELLSHQPEFNITDFSGSLPEGDFQADLTSKLGDQYTPTLDDLFIPEFWLYNSLVNANIEIDDKLVSNLAERFLSQQMNTTVDSPAVKQQVQLFINHFEQQGFFIHEDEKYRSKLKVEGGETYINGQFVPLI